MGDAWVELAGKFAGTHTEVQCNYSALECYYLETRKLRGRVCWSEANDVIAALREQKVDPEMRSRMAFTAVSLLLEKGDYKAALELLNKRLTAKKYSNLTSRFNMDDLSAAMVAPAAAQLALPLLDKLDAVCWTRRDGRELDLLRGDVMVARKAAAEGAKCYMKVVDDNPWPASELATFQKAFRATGDTGQLASMVDAYVAGIKGAQDVVPGLYADLARRQAAAKDAAGLFATLAKLVETYPASNARGQVEAVAAAAMKKGK